MSTGIKVSLCIIARNEEECITDCITSVRRLAQEIILVDTGSGDRTAEAASRAGAKVFAYAWNDDFAAARNFSLDQAAGQWILVLDADEIMEPVKPDQFGSLLEAPNVEGYFVNIHSYLGDGHGGTRDQVVRLFKNRPEYRFEGAIHEQVAISIKRNNNGGGLAFSSLLIHHFGYLDRQVRQKNKFRRNISVILKALAETPGDPFLHYSLGIEYYHSGETAGGNRQMEKALSLMRGDEGYLRDALVSLGLGLLEAGEYTRLSQTLDKYMPKLPFEPELRLVRGLLDIQEGRYQAASVELEAALTGGAQAPPGRIHSLLGDTYYMQGLYNKAEGNYLQALTHAPNALYPLTRLLEMRCAGRSRMLWEELSRFAPRPLMQRLREDLFQMGEHALALVLALLSVVEAAGSSDAESIARACLEYRQALENNFPGTDALRRIMLLCSEEMLLHGDAARRNISCDFYLPVKEVKSLAMANLELIVEALCPSWSPMAGTCNGKE